MKLNEIEKAVVGIRECRFCDSTDISIDFNLLMVHCHDCNRDFELNKLARRISGEHFTQLLEMARKLEEVVTQIQADFSPGMKAELTIEQLHKYMKHYVPFTTLAKGGDNAE